MRQLEKRRLRKKRRIQTKSEEAEAEALILTKGTIFNRINANYPKQMCKYPKGVIQVNNCILLVVQARYLHATKDCLFLRE